MKARIAVLGLAVAALAGCGSSTISNGKLASDLTHRIGLKTPLVCWQKTGTLGSLSAMGYTRVCGISQSRPSLYVRTGTDKKPGWCLVTPRYIKAPRCPL